MQVARIYITTDLRHIHLRLYPYSITPGGRAN